MRRIAGLILFAVATAATAEPPTILSARPDKVAVTFYRDPARSLDDAIDKDEPTSFALIAETRTVNLPPGIATVRFEGVAGGIVPQSAILFGAPTRERNRDAALLSQGGLVDAFTGQQVILRRTDKATGKTIEERATIRSAANRLIISTPRGAEAVYCSGLAQTLIYPHAPSTLSAKPVLSMTTRNQPGGTVTITLAYIATGFDWDATYVGTLADDGQSMNLLSWLTMASADETSFPDATTSAVAGRVNRSDADEDDADDTANEMRYRARNPNRQSRCWPQGTTSGVRRAVPPPPPPPAPMMFDMAAGEIVVTGSRIRTQGFLSPSPAVVTAKAEDLGDLKLYRIPIPVTVAAHSQKQVAFLAKDAVKGTLLYRSRVQWAVPDDPIILFRFRNSKANGMGDPIPAGKTILYQNSEFGRQLVGEHWIDNKTIDEDVEFTVGDADDVTVDTHEDDRGKDKVYKVTISNANPFPVRYEMEFEPSRSRILRKPPGRMIDKPGKRVWSTILEPNSERTVSYSFRDIDD